MEEQKNLAWNISDPSKLVKVTSPIPRPGPNQVLVRVAAISLNYRDIVVYQHSHHYPLVTEPDLIPGSDAAGTIEAVGAGSVWASRIGEKVVLHPHTWLEGDASNFVIDKVWGAGGVHGTLQRYLLADDKNVIEAPRNLGMEETATLPTAGLTAWNALFEGPIKCRSGSIVLTQGTGGVSCFTTQLAAAAGATVIATSSSDAKLEIAKKLGAQYLINYRTRPDWSKEVMRITKGRGVDHVVDVAGASSIEESLLSARQAGLVSVLGMLSESKKTDLIPLVMLGGKTIRGITGSGSGEMLVKLTRFVEEYDIHPVISHIFEFDQAVKAFTELEKRNIVGKVVIKV